VAFRVERLCPHDFGTLYALEKAIYALKWTLELFIVCKHLPTMPPRHKLSDEMCEPIKGKFYAQELQKASPPDRYRIEKIICSQRGRDEKVRHYDRCQCYPDKFNSWIDEIVQDSDARA